MPRDDIVIIERRAYSWRALIELRRAQREAARPRAERNSRYSR